jgi:hypothetical protein
MTCRPQTKEEIMKNAVLLTVLVGAVAVSAAALAQVAMTAQPLNLKKMSFFITSRGSGDGGNLGGLAGADKICSNLALAAGAPAKKWRAYLSTTGVDGKPAIAARSRIGTGPWYNARGEEVGKNVADLHRVGSPINKETALDERGNTINGRGDTPNKHDILTGSNLDGSPAADNCNNWTSNGAEKARVGHFDRVGGGEIPGSWGSAHVSRSCSQPDLQATGGDGLFYCFASR